MTLQNLMMICCTVTGQEIDRVMKKDRFRELVFTRQLFFFFGRQYLGVTLRDIQNFYPCDHSVIIYSVGVIYDLLHVGDERTVDSVEAIKRALANCESNKRLTVFVPNNVEIGKLSNDLVNVYGCRVISDNI